MGKNNEKIQMTDIPWEDDAIDYTDKARANEAF